MEMKKFLEDFKEIEKSYKDQKKKFASELKLSIGKFAKELLFSEYPDLKHVAWTQYTPYFADGDKCEFSVHSDSPYINGKNSWGDVVDDYSEEKHGTTLENMESIEKKAQKFINSIPESLLEKAFGEGMVCIDRDGNVSVEDYEHE